MKEILIIFVFASLTELGAVKVLHWAWWIVPGILLAALVLGILFPGIGRAILRFAGTVQDE